MPTGLDPTADRSGAELSRLARRYTLPDFVKQADMQRVFAPRDRAAGFFADMPHREYPCDTAPATFLSAMYFLDKAAQFHPKEAERIEERLSQFADYWGIKEAYVRLRGEARQSYKAAAAAGEQPHLPDSAYGYVHVDPETGHKERRLRLASALDCKEAAEWLHHHRAMVPFLERHAIAQRVRGQAARLGANLGKLAEFVERQAGRGVCNPDEVNRMLQQRVALAKTAAQRETATKLADAVRQEARQALHPGVLVKLAAAVDSMDRLMGLHTRYDASIQPPEDVLFQVTYTKIASLHNEHVTTHTGRIYDKQALSRLSLDDVRGVFGDEFVERVRDGINISAAKMAEEAATLPRPDAEMLDDLLHDRGVAPVMTKAAAARPIGLAPQTLRALAQQYR